MSRRSARCSASATRPRIRQAWLLSGLVMIGCALGCATTSPYNQDFVEVETPHFVLTSSLGEEATIELARNLEFFHAGVVDAVGLAGEPASGPGRPPMPQTRVYAFDDRSVERPFAVRGEASQILNRPEGMVWVFRAGRSFDERVSVDLRHRYAHQLIRDLSPTPRPLWYEEGVAQLAGTVEEAMEGVRIGQMVAAHRQLLLDWRRSTLAAKIRKTSVADDSGPERRLFEAQSWGIAHTLRFDENAPNDRDSALARYRRTLDEGGPLAREKAREALAMSDERLTQRVYQHVERKRLRIRLVKVEGWDPEKLLIVPLPDAEARVRLASLALLLGRPSLARDYFDRALRADPNQRAAQAGLAVVAAWDGDEAELDARAAAALAGGAGEAGEAESDPEILRRLGEAYRVAAQMTSSDSKRSARLAQAEAAFAAVLRARPRDIGARIEMGQLELIAAGTAQPQTRKARAQRAMEWFEASSALRPGSLWVELWKAHADLAAGLPRAATLRAKEVISRTHAPEIESAAWSLIEDAEGRRR